MQKKMPEPIERIPEEEELVHALRFLFRDPKLCTSKALHQALKDRYPGWIVNQRRVKKIVRNFSCRGDESIEDAHKGWDDETHEYWDKSSWTFVPEEEREEEEEEEGFVLVHRVTV
mmetsp:Transcript_28208/g.63831  ORF Transcript_28208/g.63831 Transcript_28208/m.63831 type:complete len:116 (-) Transcript_28208:123-470(-)